MDLTLAKIDIYFHIAKFLRRKICKNSKNTYIPHICVIFNLPKYTRLVNFHLSKNLKKRKNQKKIFL